jgi:hypothetical protein
MEQHEVPIVSFIMIVKSGSIATRKAKKDSHPSPQNYFAKAREHARRNSCPRTWTLSAANSP